MTHPTSDHDDNDLRALLHDTVTDVHPAHGVEAIQARTARENGPSTSRWMPLTVAAAAAVALVMGGTVWIANLTSDDSPVAGPNGPRTGGADLPPRDVNVPVYYVGATAAGPRLFVERHSLRGATATSLQVAVDQAFTAPPDDPDYRNELRSLGVHAAATADNDFLTIDLDGPLARPESMDEQTAQMTVQSLVWTAEEASFVERPVRFTVNGSPTDHVLGVDVSQPLEKASADSVLSAVSITSPGQGAHLYTTFTVRGRAAAFEANVAWELKQGDRVVKHGFTTALECCTLSPYGFDVSAPPGDYTIVVHDVDESGGEGIGTTQDSKDITIGTGQ